MIGLEIFPILQLFWLLEINMSIKIPIKREAFKIIAECEKIFEWHFR